MREAEHARQEESLKPLPWVKTEGDPRLHMHHSIWDLHVAQSAHAHRGYSSSQVR